MKNLVLVLAIAAGSVASAQEMQWPDFDLLARSKYGVSSAVKKAIKSNSDVKAYVSKLGAQSITVTKGNADLYDVATNNGCSFDVAVVYNKSQAISDVVVYDNAACK